MVNPDLIWVYFLVALVVKNPLANAGDVGLIPGSGRALQEEMATHSSILPGKFHGQRSLVCIVHGATKS